MYVKINELFETLNVRFGTMVIGRAMSGKTTIMTSLKAALNNLHEIHTQKVFVDDAEKDKMLEKYPSISCTTINPKSVTMGELYGEEDLVKKEWSDGLASHYIRLTTLNDVPGMKWICFDGPVDALWIENMNSVLDDSRMLCLSNG